MIMFFYFTENVKVNHREFNQLYEHRFEGILEKETMNVSFEHIYFSTPSDFNLHMEEIRLTYKGNIDDLVKVIRPEAVSEQKRFPKHIGFQSSFEEQVEEFKGQPTFKVAILNAMSNALGDHVIGMQAFDYWQDKLRSFLPETEVSIAFFQLNAVRLGSITKQWHPKFNHIFMLPNRCSRLFEFDAFIDLGALLAKDNFDTKPMIDFFYEALSIDPTSVPKENKRIKFKPSEKAMKKAKSTMDIVRRKTNRPILLFHRTSTSAIREMNPTRSRQVIKQIIDSSDYFVVSADGLEYFNDRFLDLSFSSTDLDAFVSIIANVDAIVTVDTSTYHFADAFDKPTVVLFTSIDPKYRTPYYPFVDSIMLEKEDGMLYGKHHVSKQEDEKKQQLLYVDKLWESLDVSEVLKKLKEVG